MRVEIWKFKFQNNVLNPGKGVLWIMRLVVNQSNYSGKKNRKIAMLCVWRIFLANSF